MFMPVRFNFSPKPSESRIPPVPWIIKALDHGQCLRNRQDVAGEPWKGRSRDIEPDEDLGHALGFDALDLLVGGVIVDHTTENHIHECVNPQRGEQDEQLCSSEGRRLGLVQRRVGTHDQTQTFPTTADDDHPAEFLTVENGQRKVADEGHSEEDGEDNGGGGTGTVGILRILIGEICVNSSVLRGS